MPHSLLRRHLPGEIVEVTLDPIAINGAGVAIPDVLATNGVVHVIDAVLTPPEGL